MFINKDEAWRYRGQPVAAGAVLCNNDAPMTTGSCTIREGCTREERARLDGRRWSDWIYMAECGVQGGRSPAEAHSDDLG